MFRRYRHAPQLLTTQPKFSIRKMAGKSNELEKWNENRGGRLWRVTRSQFTKEHDVKTYFFAIKPPNERRLFMEQS
jgi:hypothetical protein